MRFEPAVFVKSAGDKKGFIHDGRPCVVFSGKSNVGKSSVINCLLNRRNLARVGSAPGKTTNVNYFLVADAVWFVDLPGYGYARVSQTEKERWGRLMEDFFSQPENITLGVQIVDGRHKPTELDCMMNGLFESCGCPRIVVANKWDKLKKSEMEPNLALIRETLALEEDIMLLPFSAEKRTGRQELMSAVSALV
ncbi:MAG: ribosome biogenesis GTP-binding protein YihA/YsxC [Oscillospiraceae bacterium]|nr:ribosome biogenesis GTP-binding protein YihA/YsxC [Oscillospiraceae bacterium]